MYTFAEKESPENDLSVELFASSPGTDPMVFHNDYKARFWVLAESSITEMVGHSRHPCQSIPTIVLGH